MPVYIRKNISFTPPSIDKLSVEDEDDYVTDPDQIKDELPQPYRMIDKVLMRIVDNVCEITADKEKIKLAELTRVRPPQYECAVKLESYRNVSCLAESGDGRYVFLGLMNGLAVIDALSHAPIARLEETGMEITSLVAYSIGQHIYMLVTIDDMGFARLFAVAGDCIFLLKVLNEQEGSSKLIASKCQASAEGDYVGITLENPASSECWFEVLKLPRDAWLKELENLMHQKMTEKKDVQQEMDQQMDSSQTDIPSVKTGSPVPPDKPAGNYKFSLPSSVLKVRSPTTITACNAVTINLACQKVEGGDVVAMGNNHILTQSHLDQRRKVFDVLHENILHYLPKEDKTISTSYTANFHFLNAGRMVPHTVEQSSSAGHATTVAVWWSGQTQISVFSLLKSSKDSVFKPDMVWPYTCRITCTSVSLDTAWIAIGLENGLVVLWDRYIGIQRGVINISDVSSIKAVHFLDSPEVENEPPSYRTKSCAGLLVICGQGSMHTVFCVPGDEIRHTCVFQLSDDDSLMPTKVICLRKLPELILCVLRNGTVQLRNIQESSLLCEVVLPVQYELRTPWHPVTTLAGHDQMLFIRGALKEKDMEGATRSDEEVGDLFVFQLRSFLTLDPFWNKIRSLPSSYHHCTAEERVAASLKERIAQQGLRKSRMQERWFLLRQEIENIEKYKETAVTNFEARHLYTPESVGWEPMLT